MTKTAAVQYAPEGIRVNSIHPGAIDTPMVQDGVPAEVLEVLVNVTPMGRLGRAEQSG